MPSADWASLSLSVQWYLHAQAESRDVGSIIEPPGLQLDVQLDVMTVITS